MKSAKPKRCKHCMSEFIPSKTTQKACSIQCAIELGKAKREADRIKSIRKEVREGRERLKTRAQWLKEAQTQFNRFIRLRDNSEPCICCDRHHEGQYHAGHYLSVGSHPELRFDEDNCHKQASYCNNHKSGNQQQYRLKLLIKIGADRLNRLESKHEPLKLTIDQIKDIKREYKLKADALKKEIESEAENG